MFISYWFCFCRNWTIDPSMGKTLHDKLQRQQRHGPWSYGHLRTVSHEKDKEGEGQTLLDRKQRDLRRRRLSCSLQNERKPSFKEPKGNLWPTVASHVWQAPQYITLEVDRTNSESRSGMSPNLVPLLVLSVECTRDAPLNRYLLFPETPHLLQGLGMTTHYRIMVNSKWDFFGTCLAHSTIM